MAKRQRQSIKTRTRNLAGLLKALPQRIGMWDYQTTELRFQQFRWLEILVEELYKDQQTQLERQDYEIEIVERWSVDNNHLLGLDFRSRLKNSPVEQVEADIWLVNLLGVMPNRKRGVYGISFYFPLTTEEGIQQLKALINKLRAGLL